MSKRRNRIAGDLKRFLESSEVGIRFFIPGCFDLSERLFLEAYDHFRKTGENIVDEYALLLYSLESAKNKNCHMFSEDPEDIEALSRILNGEGGLNPSRILDEDETELIQGYIERLKHSRLG